MNERTEKQKKMISPHIDIVHLYNDAVVQINFLDFELLFSPFSLNLNLIFQSVDKFS